MAITYPDSEQLALLPPSIKDILDTYSPKGPRIDGDILLAILQAKAAEDQRITVLAALQQQFLALQSHVANLSQRHGLLQPSLSIPLSSSSSGTSPSSPSALSTHHDQTSLPLSASTSRKRKVDDDVDAHTANAPARKRHPPVAPSFRAVQAPSRSEYDAPRGLTPPTALADCGRTESTTTQRPSLVSPWSPSSTEAAEEPVTSVTISTQPSSSLARPANTEDPLVIAKSSSQETTASFGRLRPVSPSLTASVRKSGPPASKGVHVEENEDLEYEEEDDWRKDEGCEIARR